MSLAALAVVAFLSLGLPDGVLGVAWPSLRRSFGVPMSGLGLLLGATMTGYLGASISAGGLVARLGVGRLLAASSAVTAASALACALAPAWGVVLAAGLAAGLGAGAIDTGINAFAAARFSPRLTSWLHASYGAGATLGPLLTSAVLAAGASWRVAYAGLSMVLAALAVAFGRTAARWAVEAAPAATDTAAASLGAALRRGPVWSNVGLFFLYAGLEVGAGQWGYSWLVEGRRVAPGVAGVCVAAYWAGFSVGRVGLGALTTRLSIDALVRASLAVVPLAIVGLWAGLGPAAGGMGLAALGLALAPIFPLLVAATPARVGPAYAGHAIGLQVAAFCLGGAVLPGLAGALARHAGLDVLGPWLLGTAAALGALHEYARRPPRRPARARPAPATLPQEARSWTR